MKMRVADYIACFLADFGITNIFSVVGGGAMHLNNAFAKEKRLKKVYHHHEQACVIAAESFSRIHNEIAAVCVTSGPGGTNALTGVLCAWQDSLPVIVISGQVRSDITVDSTGLDLRQFGEQEYYIIRSVAPMTKYAVMIDDAKTIKYHLARALEMATSGRRGPVWIDVPLDIQGQMIETNDLDAYSPYHSNTGVKKEVVLRIVSEVERAKRPVFIAGSGMRTSGMLDGFSEWIKDMKIPVVCPTSTVDYFIAEDDFYFGMFGTFGGRVGNFIVQNADLLVVFGARLSFKQIGFNYKAFSPYSRKIVIDADEEELKKPTVHIDYPVHSDIKNVILELRQYNLFCASEDRLSWFSYCCYLKKKLSGIDVPDSKKITAKRFSECFWNMADTKAVAVLGNNTASVSMLQCGIKKRGQRMYGNVNCGTMGYDLPAAIGASVACSSEVYCMTGEGSMQMNLQELQTILYNDLPVKIIVFNNNQYEAIVQTHKNFFGGFLAGCTNDSGISFPPLNKLAEAYDFPYKRIENAEEIQDAVKWIISQENRAILELIQMDSDPIIPKLSSKRLDNGKIISPPIDDLAPFLNHEEYLECQFDYFVKENEKK